METLIALCDILLFDEEGPPRARLYYGVAVSLFRSYIQSNVPSDSKIELFKRKIGSSLYELDCHMAAYGSLPPHLSEAELVQELEGCGIYRPDLSREDLGDSFSVLFSLPNGHLDSQLVSSAISHATNFLCALQIGLAKITSTPTHSKKSLARLGKLWLSADIVHSALQSLRHFLSQHPPSSDTALNLVQTINLDIHLIDLFNLSYRFPEEKKNRERFASRVVLLKDLLVLSDLSLMRVRKGSKLMGFYLKLLVEGENHQVLHAIFTRMDIIPWVKIASQRFGEEHGPTSLAYEVSETELDWIKTGLESASFMATIPRNRRVELNSLCDNAVKPGNFSPPIPRSRNKIPIFK